MTSESISSTNVKCRYQSPDIVVVSFAGAAVVVLLLLLPPIKASKSLTIISMILSSQPRPLSTASFVLLLYVIFSKEYTLR